MPTTVPKPKEEHEVIARALALEHDCTAAYSEAAPKASDQQLKEHFSSFAADCARHVDQWKARLEQVPDKESGISKPLNQGKVKLAGLIGDKALVKAVQNNADDSSSAYQGITSRVELSQETIKLAQSMLGDTERHAKYFKSFLAGSQS